MSDSHALEVGQSGLIFLIGLLFSMLGGFVLRIVLANGLTPTGFGSVMLALSLLSVLSIPTLLGLNLGIIKFLPEQRTQARRNQFISATILIVGGLSIVVVGLLSLLSGTIHSILFSTAVSTKFMVILILCIPVFSLDKLIKGVLRGSMEVKRYVLMANVVNKSAQLVFALVVVSVAASASNVLGAIVLAFLMTVIYGFKLLYDTGWRPSLDRSLNVRPLLRFSFPLLISSSIYLLLTRVDRVLIGYFKVPSEVGIYEVALALALLLGVFKSAFQFLLYPKISELNAEGRASEIIDMYAQTTKWILISTTPAFLILLARPQFLVGLFGEEYTLSLVYTPLAILGIALFIDSVVGPNGQALLGFGKSKQVMYYNGAALILNLLLNVTLIPTYGLVGAAFATFVGYAVMNLLKSRDLYRNHGIVVVNWPGVKSAIASGLVVVPILYWTTAFSTVIEFVFLVLIGVVSLSVSILVLWATDDLTVDDREMLSTLIRPLKQIA